MSNETIFEGMMDEAAEPFRTPWLAVLIGAVILAAVEGLMLALHVNDQILMMTVVAVLGIIGFFIAWFAPSRSTYGITFSTLFEVAMGKNVREALPAGLKLWARAGGYVMTIIFVSWSVLLGMKFHANPTAFLVALFAVAGLVTVSLVRGAKSGKFTTNLLIGALIAGPLLYAVDLRIPVGYSASEAISGLSSIASESAEIAGSEEVAVVRCNPPIVSRVGLRFTLRKGCSQILIQDNMPGHRAGLVTDNAALLQPVLHNELQTYDVNHRGRDHWEERVVSNPAAFEQHGVEEVTYTITTGEDVERRLLGAFGTSASQAENTGNAADALTNALDDAINTQ